jgi:hypothetical protein
MALVAEPFLRGMPYDLPGASLWNMDVPKNSTEPENFAVAFKAAGNLYAGVCNSSRSPIYYFMRDFYPIPLYCYNGTNDVYGIDP